MALALMGYDREEQIERVKSLSEQLVSAFNRVLAENEEELSPRMKVKAAAVATWIIRQSYAEDSHMSIGATFENTYNSLEDGGGI